MAATVILNRITFLVVPLVRDLLCSYILSQNLGLTKTEIMQLSIPALLALEDLVVEAKFHAGNPAYKEERFEDLKSRLRDRAKQLSKKGDNRRLLWEEYKQGYPEVIPSKG